MAHISISKNSTSIEIIKELGNIELTKVAFVSKIFPSHSHEDYSFAVVEKGNCKLYCNHNSHHVHNNFITVLHPEEVHSAEINKEVGMFYRTISIKHEFLETIRETTTSHYKGTCYFKNRVIRDRHLAKLFSTIHEQIMCATELIEAKSLIYDLFFKILRQYSFECTDKVTYARHNFDLVKEYIYANYWEKLTLDDLAEKANLSVPHFFSLFKEQFNVSPYTYLINVRVAKAKQMIRKGNSISQTALNAGFVDQSHLNKAFKSILSITPGQYKRAWHQ